MRIAIALTLLAMVAPPFAPVAAAQNPLLPLGLDLNGTWEMTEHGARKDQAANPIVSISHTPTEVRVTFMSGGECYDGTARSTAFVGKLSVLVPGEWALSATDMWVCSGSPSVVQKCGGQMKSNYITSFKNASVSQYFIEGTRVTQGYRGCTPDSASDGTALFTLTRLRPCELEQRKQDQRERELLDMVESMVLEARPIFMAASQAAEQRYGQNFRGLPTGTVAFPYAVVGGDWYYDIETAEDYVANRLPATIPDQQWINARNMATAMASDSSPLPQVTRMIEEMRRMESGAPARQAAVTELRNARTQVEACIQRPPQ